MVHPNLEVKLFHSIATALTLLAAVTAHAGDDHGRALLGQPAKDWRVENWLNSPPLELKQLRGKVVLVRWWTAPDCRYCAATAPALNEFHEAYRERGLVVVGFYHHKSPSPLRPDDVKAHAESFGFKFPVAIDPKWRTLKQWWLDGSDRDFTSVSFLIDRTGRIRHIHPGGEYVKGDADYAAMKRKIEELLAEPASKASPTRAESR
jgi:peroxiredoxin